VRRSLLTLIALLGLAFSPPASAAVAPQPPVDREILKSLWKPIGFFKPGDAIPMPSAPPAADANGLYNPSGHFSAYDTNVFESLNFPGRQSGDETSDDPPGSGDPRFGHCPPHPQYMPQGRCANHANEYLAYYERTMREILKDFGGVVHRYEFENPGRSDIDGAAGEPGGLSSPGGRTENIAGIVPGADNPEEEVIVSGHWDFTDAAHAAAWDSAEGHAEVIRMAKIMTDYWRATGTRPSATVKFMPWGAEESGTYGSQDYVERHIVEGDGKRIRGYFNVDPCAGAFPAFYHGNPAEQINMVQHLVDPAGAQDAARVTAFNEKAVKVVDQFWAEIDDTVQVAGGVPMPVFTDGDRDKVNVALGGLLVFGSDYLNFEAIGVPFMNLFPDMFGPHADGSPASGEGAATIHTPRDSLQTLNQLTSGDQTGLSASDGWMKGMELCAQLNSRYMLEPEMGGAQAANPEPVAYFEPLPFRAGYPKGKLMTFDAGGSYQYAQLATRQYAPDSDLQYRWDFGDKSAPAFGKVVKHAFKRADTFKVTLTVTNRTTHASDTMSTSVLIADATDSESDPSDQTQDPGLRPKGSVTACQGDTGFTHVKVTPAAGGLRFEGEARGSGSVVAEVFQVAKGRRAQRPRKVASFAFEGSQTWDGMVGGRPASGGTYYVRMTARGTGPRPDVRSFAFERPARTFKARKPFQRKDSCDNVSLFRLDAPAFGGKRRLAISFTTRKSSRVAIEVLRGSKRVKRFRVRTTANRLAKAFLSPKRLPRGEYRIVLRAGGKPQALYARKL
jgi:hypothetical protein